MDAETQERMPGLVQRAVGLVCDQLRRRGRLTPRLLLETAAGDVQEDDLAAVCGPDRVRIARHVADRVAAGDDAADRGDPGVRVAALVVVYEGHVTDVGGRLRFRMAPAPDHKRGHVVIQHEDAAGLVRVWVSGLHRLPGTRQGALVSLPDEVAIDSADGPGLQFFRRARRARLARMN